MSQIRGLPALSTELLSTLRRSRIQDEELARDNRHLAEAVEEEKLTGMRIAIVARTVSLLVVALLLPITNFRLEVLYYEFMMLIFILIGLAQLRVARVGQSRLELALIFADLFMLGLVLLLPNPFLTETWPSAIQVRFDGFMYFYLLLALSTLAYSWRTVISFGAWVPMIWGGGLMLLWYFGTSVPLLSDGMSAALASHPRLFDILNPNSLEWQVRIQEIVVFALVSAILALKGWRANQLLVRQAAAATERANLSRYFPPGIVDQLASRNQPMGEVRAQEVAVLFADIVGFTKIAESGEPAAVVGILRQFHALLEEAVFANHGTLDKFLGDGIMATFGTPTMSPADAHNALKAGADMLRAVDEWNATRVAGGEQAIKLSVGIHFGQVILGDIGSERRLEFATLGDTVNVAARLEKQTRALECRLAASDELVSRASQGDIGEIGLQRRDSIVIRGRDNMLNIWVA
ncbi:MAG: adenylate/guanylate cyclase domain-containing protein [Rhizobiaceae bacterium]